MTIEQLTDILAALPLKAKVVMRDEDGRVHEVTGLELEIPENLVDRPGKVELFWYPEKEGE